MLLGLVFTCCKKDGVEIGCTHDEVYEDVNFKSMQVGQKSKYTMGETFLGNCGANCEGDTMIFEIIEKVDSGFIAIEYLSEYSYSNLIDELNYGLPPYFLRNDTTTHLINFENGVWDRTVLTNFSFFMRSITPNLIDFDSVSYSLEFCETAPTFTEVSQNNNGGVPTGQGTLGKLLNININNVAYSNCYLTYKEYEDPAPMTQHSWHYVVTSAEGKILGSKLCDVGIGFGLHCFSIVPNPN